MASQGDSSIVDDNISSLSSAIDAMDNSKTPMNKATTDTGSASHDTDDGIPGGINAVPKETTESAVDKSSAGDSCLWHNAIACDQPRSCRACLNVNLGDDNKCMVYSDGSCTKAQPRSSIQKVESSRLKNSSANVYRSQDFKYCGLEDSICNDWKKRWRAADDGDGVEHYHLDDDDQWQEGSMSSARFIDSDMPSYVVGDDGECLCIRACEKADWKSNVIDSHCYKMANQFSGLSYMTMVGLLMTMVVVLFISVFLFRMFQRRRMMNENARQVNRRGPQIVAQRRQPTRRPRQESAAQPMDLEGWKSFRERLIQNERTQIAQREEDKGMLSTMHAPSVVVEEGVGYRPASPSELNQRGPADFHNTSHAVELESSRESTNQREPTNSHVSLDAVEESETPRETTYQRV